jgi:excisionase family DNA binding protein
MEPLTVDIREAARLTSLSPYTIRAYIKNGRLASVRVGRRVLIEPREIVLLIEKGRTPITATENWEGAFLPQRNSQTSVV